MTDIRDSHVPDVPNMVQYFRFVYYGNTSRIRPYIWTIWGQYITYIGRIFRSIGPFKSHVQPSLTALRPSVTSSLPARLAWPWPGNLKFNRGYLFYMITLQYKKHTLSLDKMHQLCRSLKLKLPDLSNI